MTAVMADWLRGLTIASSARDPAETDALYDAQLADLRARMWRSAALLDLYRAAGASPTDLDAIGSLPRLPTTTRSLLARRWDELLAIAVDDPRLADLSVTRSTGTTGAPLRVVRCALDRAWPSAVAAYAAHCRGVDLPAAPAVALWCVLPHPMEFAGETALGPFRRIAACNGDADRRLADLAPDVVSTDPAGLQRLVAMRASVRPKLAVSSAQHLAPALRAAATAALGCPILDVYSLAETGAVAVACPVDDGAWHVLAPYVHVDSVDGELIVTRLREGALPIVRYATGDRGDVRWEACRCGRSGPILRAFVGRSPAWFRRPDGTRFDAWALAFAFRWRPIDAFRVTQRAPTRYVVEVDGEPDDIGAALVDALARLGIADAEVCVAVVAAGALAGPKPTPFVASAAC